MKKLNPRKIQLFAPVSSDYKTYTLNHCGSLPSPESSWDMENTQMIK